MQPTEYKSLIDVFSAHASRVSDKWEHYLAIYERELRSLVMRGKAVNLLEIGVQNGGSLQIWKAYLPPGSQVTGFDINPQVETLAFGDGIAAHVVDATDKEAVRAILGDVRFDIIIDDGSHICADVIKTFEHLISMLVPGGLYIVEDAHTSYMAPFGGGLRTQDSIIEYFKAFADAVNADHLEPGLDAIPGHRLADLLGPCRVDSIAFYDSIIVVRTTAQPAAGKYGRVLTGTVDKMQPIGDYLHLLPPQEVRRMILTNSAASRLSASLLDRFASTSLEVGRLQAMVTQDEITRHELNALVRQVAELELKAASLNRDLKETESKARDADLRNNELASRAQDELRKLQAELSHTVTEAERFQQEIIALRHRAERAEYLEGEVSRLNGIAHSIQVSTFWRLTGPFRRTFDAVPDSTKFWLRRGAKAGWWAATPWRMPQRVQFLRDRVHTPLPIQTSTPQDVLAPTSVHTPPAVQTSTPDDVSAPTSAPTSTQASKYTTDTQRPLQVFPVEGLQPRLSMVTDSINAGSLFGGVATALIFSALLAKRFGRRLRIVTRTQSPEAGNVATLFRAHGIDWDQNIEFAFANIYDESIQIDFNSDEIFVTTSWWTTEATRASVPTQNIIYLLQEDERMFYPMGTSQLICSEVISDQSIQKVINSALLHRHLVNEGAIQNDTPYFEPSFPDISYYPEKNDSTSKYNFFFYARPNNARNLFGRGLEVIDAAIERGILDPAQWDIHFVGKDLQPITLSGGVKPIFLQNMDWISYAAYVRSVDLALTLMYTPHPSYPPLDVAACGGIAVTNRFGVKTDLSKYSSSIICAESDLASLVEGLKLGVDRVVNASARRGQSSGIGRDWAASFEPVIAHLLRNPALVR